MENLTTIRELQKTFSISDQRIRILFDQNEIVPVEKKKITINGYSGHAYLKTETEPIIRSYAKSKENIDKFIKKCSNEFIYTTLRRNIKHYLNDKEIIKWNAYDWQEFEKLKN